MQYLRLESRVPIESSSFYPSLVLADPEFTHIYSRGFHTEGSVGGNLQIVLKGPILKLRISVHLIDPKMAKFIDRCQLAHWQGFSKYITAVVNYQEP